MKLKVDDLVLLASYLDKNCRSGEVDWNIPIGNTFAEIKLSTTVGEERTIRLYAAESYRMPKIICEDLLNLKK